MKTPLSHYLEYGLLRSVCGAVAHLPYPSSLAIGEVLATLSFALARRRMARFERRLRQVFGDKFTPSERWRILRQAWINLGRNAIETMAAMRWSIEDFQKAVDVSPIAILFSVLKEGRGAILAVPHVGNWELAGAAAGRLGAPLMVIARRQKNVLTTNWLNRVRQGFGIEVFDRQARSLTGIVKGLRSGKVLAILPDLRAKGPGVDVPFLGHVAHVPAGMGKFARDSGAPIIPVCPVRVERARHRWLAFPEVRSDPSASEEADIARMTREVMAIFDEVIRQYPDQYHWFNGRWILGEEPPA